MGGEGRRSTAAGAAAGTVRGRRRRRAGRKAATFGLGSAADEAEERGEECRAPAAAGPCSASRGRSGRGRPQERRGTTVPGGRTGCRLAAAELVVLLTDQPNSTRVKTNPTRKMESKKRSSRHRL
jgi:hypothetical protein